jgi:formylglycine-generating enzyme required for sulfatase activity
MRKTFVPLIIALGAMVAALGGQRNPPPREFTNTVGMKFVWIDPGSFQMGSTTRALEERPVHEVTLSKGFYLQATEVTQAQWEAVMGTNPSHFKGPDRPVDSASWDDAQEFLGKLNAMEKDTRYRLPTEAEWEYACRASGQEPDEAPNLDEVAWWEKNSGSETHPVAQKKPNAWGLYDMRGNVWEWVQDWYDEYGYPPKRQADPQGPLSGRFRVLRGGSWSNVNSDFLRCSHRLYTHPAIRSYGFRCARSF